MPVEAANVARLYRQLADLRDGTQHVPSFRDAHALHMLIEQIPSAPAAGAPTTNRSRGGVESSLAGQ